MSHDDLAPDRITREYLQEVVDGVHDNTWWYLLKIIQDRPEFYQDKDVSERFLLELPLGLHLYYWLVIVHDEIDNGCVQQLFYNHGPWELRQAIHAMILLGAADTAEHLRRAMHVFEAEQTPEIGHRYAFDLGEYYTHPILNSVQNYFDKGESKRDYALMYERMRQHPEQFLHG